MFKKRYSLVHGANGVVDGRNIFLWPPCLYGRRGSGAAFEGFSQLLIELKKWGRLIGPSQEICVRSEWRPVGSFAPQGFQGLQRALWVVHL